MSVNLEDLIPRKSKFYLSETGVEYSLRPWTLKDQIWMKQEYGDKAKDMFVLELEKLDLSIAARMMYRLIEDKTDFMAKEIIEIDENGEEKKIKIGGYKALLSMIKGFKEQVNLIASLAECIGASNDYVGKVRDLGDMMEGGQKKSL